MNFIAIIDITNRQRTLFQRSILVSLLLPDVSLDSFLFVSRLLLLTGHSSFLVYISLSFSFFCITFFYTQPVPLCIFAYISGVP